MPDEIAIRTYRESDLGACRELWVELTERHRDLYASPDIGGGDPGAEFDAQLAEVGSDNIFVAELDDSTVGLAGLIPGEQPELEPVVIAAAVRGRGVGRALVDHVFACARERGIRRLIVRPVARNDSALRFFRGLGFQTLGQVELLAWLDPGPRWGRAGATLRDVDFDL